MTGQMCDDFQLVMLLATLKPLYLQLKNKLDALPDEEWSTLSY